MKAVCAAPLDGGMRRRALLALNQTGILETCDEANTWKSDGQQCRNVVILVFVMFWRMFFAGPALQGAACIHNGSAHCCGISVTVFSLTDLLDGQQHLECVVYPEWLHIDVS